MDTINIYDQKPNGIAGGVFASNRWITRVLNTINGNTNGRVFLNNNSFVLLPGKYIINANLPAFSVNNHQARLFNVTTNTAVCYGNTSYSSQNEIGNQTNSFIYYNTGILTVPTTFRIEHKCESTQLYNGFGVPTPFDINQQIPEVYSIVQITLI